jgi:hypothetical protein
VILFSIDGAVIHIFRVMLDTGFVKRVHDFAVQGGAITSFVGYCMLNKHFRYSIWDHNSSVTTNAGILILLLTNLVSMFVSGSGKSHK